MHLMPHTCASTCIVCTGITHGAVVSESSQVLPKPTKGQAQTEEPFAPVSELNDGFPETGFVPY